MSDHAILSASGASRWMACPPSARLEEKEPKETTRYAKEGTLAHAVAEKAIASSLFGDKSAEYEDEEMRGYIEGYTEYITRVVAKYLNARVALEVKVDFSHVVPGGFGTVDVLVIGGDTVEVIDLKYGKGVRVAAKDNPQLRLYALGALKHATRAKMVIMTIHQPRLDHISQEWLDVAELNDWAYNVVAPKARRAWAGVGRMKSGDHCRFCKVKPKCKEYSNGKLETLKDLIKLNFKVQNNGQKINEFNAAGANTRGGVGGGVQKNQGVKILDELLGKIYDRGGA